jgi:hypothetical protein
VHLWLYDVRRVDEQVNVKQYGKVNLLVMIKWTRGSAKD